MVPVPDFEVTTGAGGAAVTAGITGAVGSGAGGWITTTVGGTPATAAADRSDADPDADGAGGAAVPPGSAAADRWHQQRGAGQQRKTEEPEIGHRGEGHRSVPDGGPGPPGLTQTP